MEAGPFIYNLLGRLAIHFTLHDCAFFNTLDLLDATGNPCGGLGRTCLPRDTGSIPGWVFSFSYFFSPVPEFQSMFTRALHCLFLKL